MHLIITAMTVLIDNRQSKHKDKNGHWNNGNNHNDNTKNDKNSNNYNNSDDSNKNNKFATFRRGFAGSCQPFAGFHTNLRGLTGGSQSFLSCSRGVMRG